MGGGGGGRFIGPISREILEKLQESRREEQERLDRDVNDLLKHLLARYNSRDTDEIKQRIDQINQILAGSVEIETILYGGSVAKHTAVDGLSDVDALVILGDEQLQGKSPRILLDRFHKLLGRELHLGNVESIEKGRLAVTVRYRDMVEIQLLPALRTGKTISIASADSRSWNDTHPRRFQAELAQANQRLNGGLIPAIKLLKSLNSTLPEQKQMTGYHIEAMAVEAARDYKGAANVKGVLLHLLGFSAERVLTPIRDKTGQSRTVDRYLGAQESLERRNISLALTGLKRRLEAATSVRQWSTLFEG